MKAFLLLSAFALVGCATPNEKKEIREKAAETTVSDGKALGNTIEDLINSSKTLSEAKKNELRKIMEENKNTAQSLTEKSFKFRSVLIQELLSGDPSKKKIGLIKKDIKRIEDLKLKNTFDTVEKISTIVSKDPDKKGFAERLMIYERPLPLR